MRGGDFAKQSGFPCIRITDQTGIGDRPQFQQEMTLLTFTAFGVFDAARGYENS